MFLTDRRCPGPPTGTSRSSTPIYGRDPGRVQRGPTSTLSRLRQRRRHLLLKSLFCPGNRPKHRACDGADLTDGQPGRRRHRRSRAGLLVTIGRPHSWAPLRVGVRSPDDRSEGPSPGCARVRSCWSCRDGSSRRSNLPPCGRVAAICRRRDCSSTCWSSGSHSPSGCGLDLEGRAIRWVESGRAAWRVPCGRSCAVQTALLSSLI